MFIIILVNINKYFIYDSQFKHTNTFYRVFFRKAYNITNVNLKFWFCVFLQNDVLRYITSNNMHSEILNKPIR